MKKIIFHKNHNEYNEDIGHPGMTQFLVNDIRAIYKWFDDKRGSFCITFFTLNDYYENNEKMGYTIVVGKNEKKMNYIYNKIVSFMTKITIKRTLHFYMSGEIK